MIIYPAIDILDAEVVRLIRGDFEQKTVFPQNPVEAARAISASGAQFLHLVDLSGARNPKDRQLKIIGEIIGASGLNVQIGGGIRTLVEIEALFAIGADRVVIGSLIVTEPNVALEALDRFGPDKITFALDIQYQDGRAMVMSHGWARSSGLDFSAAARPFVDGGLKRVLCTDIDVDGRLVGPNLRLYRDLRAEFPELEIQASGGVAKLNDLRELESVGAHSVVIGRALLAGAFTLKEALDYAH